MDLLSQNPQISSDPGTKGFDLSAGKTWIYPENYPVRDYQFDIVQAALYSNTMVCLPTGLGKTFIAAVVMYNFWRWYPRGKVVFLAPTRPLVAQQIYACHNTMGIPSTETVELTGAVNKKQREIAWRTRRVIFATPQVFHNDLQNNIVPGELIKCVVIDEAHKALGKHSYCECIRLLSKRNLCFRVLALSATPGNKIDNVHEVIKNLCIAHVEVRDETSPDVIPYINQRKIDVILVPLSDELAKHKDSYIRIMDRHVRVLLRNNVLQGDAGDISKGRIFHLMTTFQKKTEKSGNYGQIMKTLNILMTMYHAYELLVRDGLRAFYKFYQNHSEKFWMNDEIQLQELLEEIGAYLGPFPDVKSIRENSTFDIPKNLVFGHPKFEKLQEILLRHFQENEKAQTDTRAIIFVEYRDIVSEIFILLLRSQPLIRPQMFVGQAGQKQKQQIQALESFRKNDVNVLISTSIGEEGLDVGEVDLIICFDISQHSPTRLVQRMGRTGRKRDGHIIILVTDGREHQTLKSTMARRDSINAKICKTSNISSSLYENNPRMIPDIFKPECYKMHINVQLKTPVTKKDKKGKSKKGKEKVSNVDAESSDLQPKRVAQRSVRKFFESELYDGSSDTDFKISSTNEKTDARNVTKTSDVKILAEDNEAIDFLTICALRRSERDAIGREENNVSLSYVPSAPPVPSVKNFFHFSIPNVQILDCLLTLSNAVAEKVEGNVSKLEWKNREVSGVKEGLCDDGKSEIASERIVEASRFEDLLDESSNSTCGSVRSEDYGESKPLSERETMNESVGTLGPFSPRPRGSDFSKAPTRSEIMSVELLEPGTFENILDESSDSTEIDDEVENIKYEGGTAMAHMTDIDRKSLDIPKTRDEAVRNLSEGVYAFEERNEVKGGTRTIDEIMDSSSKGEKRETEEESENDMFWEEVTKSPDLDCPVVEIKTEGTLGNVESGKGKESRTNASELDIDNASFPEDDFDLEFGDWKWDDRPAITAGNLDSESERWISSAKSCRKNDDNARSTSIAKKLAKSKRYTMGGKTELSQKRSNDTDDSGGDDVAATNIKCAKVSEESKESRFFDKTKPSSSSDDLEMTFAVPKDPGKLRMAVNRGKAIGGSSYGKSAKKPINEFLCDEAEKTSGDSTDESSLDDDRDLSGFVSYTQEVHDSSDMQLHYLRSINSPSKRHGTFTFKERPAVDPTLDVYSQMPSQENETYEYDSFCVPIDYVSDGDKENETSTREEDMSVLERAERILELKRKRKRGRTVTEYADSESCFARRKRKRRKECRTMEASSSEDEMEKLRAQIRNESLLLARNSQRT